MFPAQCGELRMADFSEQEAKVLAALHEVNESWLTGRPDSLGNLVADES